MHYNSIDHFLTTQAERIPQLVLDAWQKTGGSYARLDPVARAALAQQTAGSILANLRQGELDRTNTTAQLKQLDAQGLQPAEVRQASTIISQHLQAWAATELDDQPDLREDLRRRIAHLGVRVRATITGIELDNTLQRLHRPIGQGE